MTSRADSKTRTMRKARFLAHELLAGNVHARIDGRFRLEPQDVVIDRRRCCIVPEIGLELILRRPGNLPEQSLPQLRELLTAQCEPMDHRIIGRFDFFRRLRDWSSRFSASDVSSCRF